MELNISAMKFVLHSFLLLLFQEFSTAVDDDIRSSCRTAPNDLVFILDGSFSVGPDNFEIVKNWIINISSSFEIGTTFTQVGVVQYSDDPVLEIPLEKYSSNEDLMKAMEAILYMGGNTRTGKAITFGVNDVFATSTRASNTVTKVAVVLTDGKSQDDVKDSAEEARKKKIILFAIGVGQEIEDAELQAIANKPSSTYVFYVEDYTGISRIREVMKQKLCEETVCPTRIPVASRDEKGFDILVGLDIRKKASKIEGSYHGKKAYRVTSQSDLTDKTRDIFPDGLPPSYVFVSTLRFKRPVTKEKWDLWRILALDGTAQAAVTLNGEDNTVIFHTTHMMNDTQSVTFTSALIQALFDENWHQLRVLVTERDATLYLDDKLIETRQLEPVLGIFISGKTQIGKYFGKEATVPFEVQKLRIYCDPEQSERETACEIPGVDLPCDNSLDDVSSTPPPCICTPGPAGPRGLKGERGVLGEFGHPGRPGADGKPGIPGLPGNPGLPGPQGIQGLRGFRGYKGEEGRHGVPGERGVPGFQGLSGPPGHMGPKGFKGEPGLRGFEGKKGAKGDKGSYGYPGLRGPPGHQGESGKNGLPGIPGTKGEPGKVGLPGLDGMAGRPGIPGMPGHLGPMGHKGEGGIPGDKGDKGPHGEKGEMGLPGVSGSRGLPGSKGSKGERGFQGIQGQYGNKGQEGEPGLPGQPGHSGMPGMKGIKGDKGNAGVKGNQGEKGITGEPGFPGVQGTRGSAGLKGETGEVGASGTAGIRGPRGEPGTPGRTGHQGRKGNNGFTGSPGPPGPEGIPGRVISDEYIRQVCMDVLRTQLSSVLRNQRSQNCWHCKAHKGSPGPPGPPGLQGPSGFPGSDGGQGQPGHLGLPGLPGIQGLMGIPGEKGEKGDRGVGYPGLQGLPGLPGSTGLPGISKEGYPGKPGSPGQAGDTGKSGRPGPPGPPGTCQPSLCYEAIVGRDPFRKGPNY
ncbi:collagen alpha-1(XXI) chain [Heptranchias perlo]|uniref:collagen alpha-1(XXI) chain n=1 Tax=Heptranchias perlo TaxID=212740 RepID=UPI003559BFF2